MKKIDSPTLAAWCTSSGYSLSSWRPSLPEASKRLRIPIPRDPQQLPDLIDSLVVFAAGCELLVWLSDRTIWDDRSQDIGGRHLALLTDRPSSTTDLDAYLLPSTEWREAVALLLLAAVYGWDAFLFFGDASALFYISHDGFVDASIRLQGPIVLDGRCGP